MLLLEAKLSLKSSRQVTKSIEGQDRIQRSDSKSLGPEEEDTEKAQCQAASMCNINIWFIYANVQRVVLLVTACSLTSGDKTHQQQA